jgi:hypothetical protein
MFQNPPVLCACKLLIHGRRKATLGPCQNHLVLAHRKRHLRTALTDRVHCSAERLTEYLRCDPALAVVRSQVTADRLVRHVASLERLKGDSPGSLECG